MVAPRVTLLEMDFDEHSRGDSPLHRLDARVKTICTFIAVLGIVTLNHWHTALLVFPICFGLVLGAKAPLKIYLRRFFYPLSVAVFVAIIQFFTYGSHVVEMAPGIALPIYQEGIHFGILIVSRIIASISVLNLLILVTPIFSVLASLRWFRVPSVMVDLAMLMFRYVFVVSEESNKIHNAQQSRCGYSKSLSYLKRMKNYGTLAAMILLRSIDRAIRVGNAMVSRGYTENSEIYTYSKRKLLLKDVTIGAFIILMIIILVLGDNFIS